MRTEKQKEHYLRNREHFIDYAKNYRAELRAEVKTRLGAVCFICSKPSECYHNIYGIEHTLGKSYIKRLRYLLEHAEDFKALCFSCHRLVHFLASNPSTLEKLRHFNLERAEQLIRTLLTHRESS